jgi:branched-chain amino acid transport system substrate-binding protein
MEARRVRQSGHAAYIRKVERRGGKLGQRRSADLPRPVSQFWTYDPKQFLANPVYSRDFPPAKHLEP